LGRLRAIYREAAQRVEELGFSQWPRQTVHGDWHPGNMLFNGSRVSAVIDYDTARTCPRIIDIANGVLQFSITMHGHDPDQWPTSLDEGRFKRFCRGYETVKDCVISTAELEALPWLMIEALVVEAIVPIAATGSFAGLSGAAFLRMVDAKTAWLKLHADRLKGLVGD
jgi:Ser/Thr protein kinase RdoA (MazF antagonist)